MADIAVPRSTPYANTRYDWDFQLVVKASCVGPMSEWTDNELAKIGSADELEITSFRNDGTTRAYTTIWVVRVGNELYVRSWHGRAAAWFRRALQRHAGRIRAGGVERAVLFEEPDDSVRGAIDKAYLTKYGRYGNTYVQPMIDTEAAEATFRLLPS
jgi:hypothetical protein